MATDDQDPFATTVTYFDGYPGLTAYRATFLGGMARVLDLGGTLTTARIYTHPWEADKAALFDDWRIAATHVRTAYETLKPRSDKASKVPA